MSLHRFVDKTRVREALERARHVTDAPIHVSLAPYFWGNVRRTAERAFRKRGLGKTADRNGVLLFIVPSRREFAIVGDAGAHQAVGQPLWESAAAIVREHFASGDATLGLVLATQELSRGLALHFPAPPAAPPPPA